jgi:hypothetical protein
MYVCAFILNTLFRVSPLSYKIVHQNNKYEFQDFYRIFFCGGSSQYQLFAKNPNPKRLCIQTYPKPEKRRASGSVIFETHYRFWLVSHCFWLGELQNSHPIFNKMIHTWFFFPFSMLLNINIICHLYQPVFIFLF